MLKSNLIALLCCLVAAPIFAQEAETTARFATFNVTLNRKAAGDLRDELRAGDSDDISKVAEIIQRIRPDVLLLNEFDYDQTGKSLVHFQKNYLGKPQRDQQAIEYPFVYAGPVNTGVDTGLDLNGDGKTGTAADSFGFGQFSGQYGMVVLSKYPIDKTKVRTFQKFLWNDMPNAMWPMDPKTGKSYYNDEIKSIFRLSSKSHWDVPVQIGDRTIHFLVSHPTPPAFDGPEDRNGCRNHDEIRLWADYISSAADYLSDDAGRRGGLAADADFVIAGDMNADPIDGDSREKAIQQLTDHPRVNTSTTPSSNGGSFYAKQQGRANNQQQGNPAHDTADFGDHSVGNLRVDYCLPAQSLTITDSGIFWPAPEEPGADLVTVSDHRLVWVDVKVR